MPIPIIVVVTGVAVLIILPYSPYSGVKGSCLTFSRLSCAEGDKRGLDYNSPETRLIPEMQFSCTGTLVGWTVSGRRGSGKMYPKLQIWRRSSTHRNIYFKNGPEIQVDAEGSACQTITRNANCTQEFHCGLSPANYVSVSSGSDIIGVEVPPLNNQAFELLFMASSREQHVWRSEITISNSLIMGTDDIRVGDDLFLNTEVRLDSQECQNNCDQACSNTSGSFQCSCIDGYTLSSDEQSCQDVNECSPGTYDHGCQQQCININGGYFCDCNSDHQLNSDGRYCTKIESSTTVTIAAAMGGAFGVGLLLINTLVVILLWIKLRKKRSKPGSNETMQQEPRDGKLYNQSTSDSELNGNSDITFETIQQALTLGEVQIPPSLTISCSNLQISNLVGQGEFSTVYRGYLVQLNTEIIAIKTLKGFFDRGAVHQLLCECAKMKNFNHPHVMELKGVCLDGGPVPYLVLPYMANGSLLSYLKKQRSSLVVTPSTETSQSQVDIIEKQLLDMCLQVAEGMEYLASEKVVHRDLAARNCMIDMNMIIKVSDFGLSVNLGDKDYYRLSAAGGMGIKLPFRWMAPETFSDYIFSEKSDVWSYGVTCWEVFTGGQAPYAGVKPLSLKTLFQEGKRLEKPDNSACSSEMYSMMSWCWEMAPEKRPSFSTLVQTISTSLEDKAGYLRVGAFMDYDGTSGNTHKN